MEDCLQKSSKDHAHMGGAIPICDPTSTTLGYNCLQNMGQMYPSYNGVSRAYLGIM
jgi:hypothetical protein